MDPRRYNTKRCFVFCSVCGPNALKELSHGPILTKTDMTPCKGWTSHKRNLTITCEYLDAWDWDREAGRVYKFTNCSRKYIIKTLTAAGIDKED